MNSHRFKQVDNLLQLVLERPPEERDAFLRDASTGDEELEREVRSLLAWQAEAGSFLESPAMEMAARTLTQPELAGNSVGHYKILEMLGAGGMGVVYKAFDTKLNRLVALKFLPPHMRYDDELKRRLAEEARAASALDHPNIVVIYEVNEAPSGDMFIAMAFHEGATLQDRIGQDKHGSGMPVAEALQIARQLASGLARAHERGIIHCDIKPSNVILAKDGIARIIDFGLAKSSEGTATVDGSTRGTPRYMSPEQASAKAVDFRTDLWSLGAVLYEMLAGEPPFRGDTHLSVMHAIGYDPAPTLREVRPDLPPAIDVIVTRALVKDPAKRYQSAGDMVRDLSAALTALDGPVPNSVRVIARRWKMLVPAAAAALVMAATGYYHFHRTPKLTDKDTIVLADFINKTGDPVFDGTLRQGLAVQLAQSPFLSLVSDQRMQEVLRLMGQPPGTRLTPEVAKEICERTASAAVLDGSIASLGSQYVIGLRAQNCRTGEVVDEDQVQAARKEDVLNALSQIASKFRSRAGESLGTIEKHSTPLAEATTPSLEALKAYSMASHVAVSTSFAASVPLFKRAVEIDPKFAMAHANLGLNYSILGESVLSVESTTKAYQLRDRASDKERLFITFTYDRQVTGNLEKAFQTLEVWAKTYPRDPTARGLLSGFSSLGTGRFEKSIEEAEIAVGLDPDQTPEYANLAFAYLYLNRPADAEKIIQRAARRKLEIPDLLFVRYFIAFLQGDKAGMDQAAAQAVGKPGAEDLMLHSEAIVLAHSGHLQRAEIMSRRAVDLAKQAGRRERAALFETAVAMRGALVGNANAARRSATAALELSRGRDVEFGAAFALAVAGDFSRSQTLAGDLERRFPEDTCVRFNYLPALRGLFALNGRKPANAIEALQIAVPSEAAVPAISFLGFFGALLPSYVRGEAFLAGHRAAEAATEFQKLLDHRGIVLADPVGVVARLQLGRALVLSGDKSKAKAVYQDFLTLWKDADRDIPILKLAQDEYAKLL